MLLCVNNFVVVRHLLIYQILLDLWIKRIGYNLPEQEVAYAHVHTCTCTLHGVDI